MDTNIDKLQIIIEAEASKAESSIDRFIESLEKIKGLSSSDFGSLGEIRQKFKDLSSSVSGASRSFKNFSEKITGMKTAMETLKGLDLSGATSFAESFKSMEGLQDMTVFGKGINDLSNGLTKLGKLDITTISKKLRELVDAIRPLTDEMIRGGSQVGTYGEQMRAFVGAAKSATSAQVQLAKAEKMSKTGTGGALGGLMGMLKGIKSTAVFAFIVKGIKEVSKVVGVAIRDIGDYVESLNLFNVSMGEFAEKAGTFVEEMEEKLGANAAEVSKNIGTFMSLAKSFGVAGDQAYLMSKNMTQLAYDYASFFNISVEDAFQKLRSGFVGEIEPMRAIGKDLSAARLQQELYNMGLNVQFESLTQADKATLRYIVTMKQSGDQMNDLARTLESPTNMIRMLNAQFQILSRTIGSIFLPALSAILPYAIAVVKVLTQVAQAIANFFGATIPEFGNTGKNFGNISEGIGGIGDAAQQANKDVLTLIGGFDELNKINVPKADAGGLGGGNILDGVELPEYNIFDELIESKVDEIVKKINDAFKELAQTLKEMGIDEVIEDFKRFGQEIWDQINNYDFGTALKENLLAAVDFAISAVNLANKMVLPLVVALDIPGIVYEAIKLHTSLVQYLDSIVESVTPGIQKFVEIGLVPMAEWLGGKVKDGLQFLSEKFKELGDWFESHTDDFTVIGEKLGIIVDGLWDFLEPLADAAWEGFKDLLSQIVDIFKNWADHLLPLITDFASLTIEAGKFLDEIGFSKSTLDFFTQQLQGVKNILEGIIDIIEGIGLLLIGQFFGDWETTWHGIEEIVGGAGGAIEGLLRFSLGNMSDDLIQFLEDVGATFGTEDWKKPWVDAWDKIKKTAEGDMDNILKAMGVSKDDATRIFQEVGNNLSTELEKMQTNFSERMTSIKEKGSEIWGQIKTGFSNFTSELTGLSTSFTNDFKSRWTTAWSNIRTTFTSAVNGIKSTASSVFSSITSAVSNMISKIKDAISRLKDLFSWKDKADDLDFGGESSGGLKGIAALKASRGVTTFATGGVVSEPTYALVGEYTSAKNNPEVIAPQSVIEQSVVNANGDMVSALCDMATMVVAAIENNAVTVEGDAEAMFKVVRKRGVEYQRNTGKPVFAP